MIDRHAHGAKHSADIWCSPGVGKLMTNAAKHYDYVVIDFPSLLTNADAEAAADYVDMFVLVAKHASTTLDELKRALESAPNVASRVLGAIVNVYGS
jgi:Mrp family chromosome partitioning ATPase